MHANATGHRPRGLGGAPDWRIQPPADGRIDLALLRKAVWSRDAASWYVGASISLIWLIGMVPDVLAAARTVWSAVLGVAAVIVFAVGFLVAPPIARRLPLRGRLWVCLTMFALSFVLFPWVGWGVVGTWTYVGVTVAMCVFSWRLSASLIFGLGILAFLIQLLLGGWTDYILWTPAIIISISLMMAAFGRSVASIHELRATQAQLEVLAAERERGRVARDIHDILGHSLTVITVKSELAGRLVDSDPARAKAEIGEVEQLARGALADVRSTVAGFRGLTVSGELVAARSALEAAGIAYEMPSSTDAVRPVHRELAGWIVREGVTNVVRHSGATRCRIRLGADSIEVADDGVGPADGSAASTGLTGLRERVEAVGGTMTVGRSDLGGFRLAVTL